MNKLAKKRYNKKRNDAYVYWSDDETIRIMFAFNNSCAYCGSKYNIELDHFIPIKRGGKTIPGNIYPVCREHNRGKDGKHAKLPRDWAIWKFGFENGDSLYQDIKRILQIHYEGWYYRNGE